MTFPEPVIPPFPGADVYGRVTAGSDPDTALTIPTVWACVTLLANAVAMLPLEAYRRTGGVPEKLPNPPLLAEPSQGMTQSEWLGSVMLSLLLRGNTYGMVSQRDTAGRPTQIELLDPDKVRVNVDPATGSLTYHVGGLQVDPNKIWHARGMTMPGSKIGMSPIKYAAATMGVDIYARTFATDYFAGGGIPKAIITSDQDLDQQQSRTIKEKFLAASSRREPVVMGAGLGYHSIQITPDEAQFLATQTFSVAQIARFFGVPPEMVGGTSGNSNTYANVEQRGLEFLIYGLGHWLKKLEDSLFGCFADPVYVRFNTAALLRTDVETQAKVHIQTLAGKIKTPTEIRAELDLPPMTDEQKAEADMVPLTITPGGGAKALPAIKTDPGAASALTGADAEDQQEGASSAA
jgi:HK97 family phage portal protein